MKVNGFFLSFCLCFYLSVNVWAEPKLAVEEPSFDFGVILQGTTAQHDFIIENRGDEPLVIEKLESSCGCTAAVVSEKTLQPNTSGRIQVKYDSRGKSGGVEKWVTIHTNVPSMQTYQIKITGMVIPSKHMLTKPQDVLFKGSCAECHVNLGVGKTGSALYQADCALCHESHPGGRTVGPPRAAMAKSWAWYLRRVTSKGRAGASMPGFLKKYGGPLSEKEIESVVKYIKGKK